MDFITRMKEQAKLVKKRIVLPEALDRRVLEAASVALQENLCEVILVGKQTEILQQATGLDLAPARIIDSIQSEKHEAYSQAFYELRKAKGMTLEKAREIIQDPVYFGMMMLQEGDADGLISGAVHSSADTLRPALQIVKAAPNTKVVSTFFVMEVPECDYGEKGMLIFGDCALNENPDAEQLAEIALASAKSMKTLFGLEPCVAMLSYSTLGSASSPMTQKVALATKLAQEKAPQLLIDGEMQLDAALVERVANLKAPASKVAGKANVLIFPDLNAGNIGYKLTERFAKAKAYGPVTQGLAKPINDLSRGCKMEDIVGVIAITAVQAQNQ